MISPPPTGEESAEEWRPLLPTGSIAEGATDEKRLRHFEKMGKELVYARLHLASVAADHVFVITDSAKLPLPFRQLRAARIAIRAEFPFRRGLNRASASVKAWALFHGLLL